MNSIKKSLHTGKLNAFLGTFGLKLWLILATYLLGAVPLSAAIPTITAQPASQSVSPGASVTFNVTAEGNEPLTYQWKKGGSEILGATSSSYAINPVHGSDAGNYLVTVSNGDGSVDSDTATLTVSPEITGQPQSVKTNVNSTVTFSVTATGTTPLSYQWKKGGTDIDGATASSLTIASAQTGNEANYTVVVSNSGGSVTSSAATLSLCRDFGDAPDGPYPTLLANNGARHLIVAEFHLGTHVDAEIDGQPNSTATGDDLAGTPDDEDGVTFTTALIQGQPATVEVVASAAGKLDAWLDFNGNGNWGDAGDQIFTSTSLVAGLNTLTVSIPLSATAGNTFARFRFSSAGGLAVTGEAADGEVEDYQVTIGPATPPSITQQPANAIVCAGSTATFTVTAAGDPPLTYQWYFNTTTLIPGATSASYSVVNAQAANAGNYSVNVSNASGDATSSEASLTVNSLTTASGPANLTVNQGQTATFTTVAGGTGPFTYTWKKGVTPLQGPDGNNSYTIASAQASDAGTYSVEVQGACNSVTNSATLTVIIPPAITQQPQSLTRTNGGSATFSVTASGTAPTYQWRFSGNNILGQTASSLTLASVSPGQAGPYSVVVSNAAGLVVSDTATLTVLVPAGIDTQPVSLVRTQGMSATFTVSTTGDTPISYQWRFNGNNISGANASSYTIPIVQLTDGGGYSVVVSNSSGSTLSSTATLTVLTPRSAIYVDFNTVGDFTNNFWGRLFNSANAGTWVETNSGGIATPTSASSRALGVGRSNNDGQTIGYLGESFDFTQIGTVLNIAVSVKAKTATQTGLPSIQLGFLNETNAYFTGDNPAAFMSARIGSQTLPSTWQLEQQTKLLGVGATTANNVGGGVTTVGNWYRFKVTFTKTAATQYTVSATLQDMGPFGTNAGANVLVLNGGTPVTVTNPDITVDSTVWGGFRYSDQRGIEAVDDFAVWGSSGPATLTQQPKDTSVEANRAASFVAKVDGLGPYTFQWFRGGTAIAGANTRTYTLTGTTADNGAQFSFAATNASGFQVSSNATLTVTADTTAPTVVSAGSLNGTRIGVCFSEPVSSATATVAGNYSVSSGTVGSVTMRPDGKSVELVMSSPASGAFTVTVSGVQDLAGNNVAGTTSASGNVLGLTAFDVNGPDGIAPLSAGSTYSCKDGEFDVTAGGADLWNAADDGHLIMGPKTGDFDVRVRHQSINRQVYLGTVASRDDFAKACLIARESTAANAISVQQALFPELTGLPVGRNFFEHSVRNATGAGMAGISGANNYANAWTGGSVNYYTTPRSPTVNWGRVRRYNDTFTFYVSSNGVNWIQTAQVYQPMAASIQAGLGLTAHFDAANYRANAEFRNLSDISFPGAVITVTAINPTPTNVPAFNPAVFTVAATVSGAAASELQYQWQRSNGSGGFTNIPGAPMTASYTTPTLFEGDTQLQWRAIVKVTGAAAVTSPVATATVFDTAPPTISAAYAPTGTVQQVVVAFSEPVAVGSADVAANYSVTNSTGGAMGVISAVFYDTRTITLTLSTAMNPGGLYGVVVNNVRDRATTPNTIAANSFKSFTVTTVGGTNTPVVIELFTGNAATFTAVANLLSEPKFINNTPDVVTFTNSFGWNPAIGSSGLDNYGARITSYFVPPSNGVYRFYIRSDDLSQLAMNTNSTGSTDPTKKVIIAQQSTACCKSYGDLSGGPNTSAGIPLNAGQKYYMEALFKEGIGGDGFTMAVREAGDVSVPPNTETATNVYFTLPTGPMAIATITPATLTIAENATATFSVSGISGALPNKFQWFQGTALVPTATAFSFTTGPLSVNDTNISFVASNYFSRAIATAVVTITPDTVAPTIASTTGDQSLTNVIVTFSERVTTATAEFLPNYSVDGGTLSILSATLQADGKTLRLTTTPQTQGVSYTIRVSNVQDRAATANTIAANSPATFSAWVFCPGLVKIEYFTGFGGTAVTDLTGNPKYISNTPDITFYTNIVSSAPNMDNYGTRVSGVFVAPASGNYTFYMRNDDGAQFFFSPDANPARKAMEINRTGVQSAYADGAGTSSTRLLSLAGGSQYYFEALHKEGIGGDYVSIAVRLPGDTTPAAGLQHINQNIGNWANPDLTSTTISITQQPVDAPDTLENRTVTFTVAAVNSGGFLQGYQWQKNGVDILGANSASYTTPLLSLADSGGLYRVKICVPGRIATSSAATVNVVADSVGPNVVAGFGDPIQNHLRIVFDEIISAATANNAANYAFSAGPNVTNATLLADGKTVLLFLDNAPPSGQYYIQAANILDIASNGGNALQNPVTPLFTAPWPCTNGVVLREIYLGNSGANDFNTMTNNPIFPNSPSQVDYLTNYNSTQSNPNVDNYSMRISGYLLPPVSGNYQFMIQSDDSGWLMVSQDAGAENKRTIIRVEGGCAGCGGPQSGLVNLTAGNAYYVETLMQEGIGGDYLTNFWKLPGSSSYTIIPGSNLVYCANPDAVTLQITQQPTNTAVFERRRATFRVGAGGTGPISYQWQTYDATFGDFVDIAGGTNASYSIVPTDASTQDGSLFRVKVSLSGGIINRLLISDTAVLTVYDDVAPPTALVASSLGGSYIKIVFDEDLDIPTATDGAVYSVSDGGAIISARLLPNEAGISNTVVLGVTGLASSTFTVSGIAVDGGGNGTEFAIGGKVFALGSGLDIDGNVGTALDPIEKGSTTVDVNHLTVVAGGSDIWNASDGFRYAYGSYTNDFDVRVRIPSLEARSRWSKAGIVVREDLSANGRDLNAVVTPAGAAAADGSGIPANDFEAGYRALPGAATTDWGNWVGARPTNSPPYENTWIRLRRTANTFTAFYASNGVNWIQFANTNLAATPFASVLYVGLGTTAHNNGAGQTTTAAYENYGRILPPTIVTPPQNQTVPVGSTVTFTVAVSGEAPFTYQWRQDGGPLLNETNATLTINNVGAGNQGSYDVLVSNLVGYATSAAATLTVTYPPVISTQPADQTVSCKSDATFTVVATGDPPLAYLWYYNESTLLSGETSASLTLHNAMPANNGNYRVVVSNGTGSVTSSPAALLVTDTIAPSIICPANMSACTSSNSARVTFTLPTATDSCDPSPVVMASPASGSDFPVGTTIVTLTATDASGNSSTCTFTVTVTHADAPNLAQISYSGGTFRFSFPSQIGCVYLIQYKDTIDASEWTTLQTVTGDGTVKAIEDATATGSSRFYQVKVQ